MSDVTTDTLDAISAMINKVQWSGTGRSLGYALGGRRAAILSQGGWTYLRHDDSRLIDISPEEWLDKETLFKRLELSYIQRMIAGEE